MTGKRGVAAKAGRTRNQISVLASFWIDGPVGTELELDNELAE